MSQIVQLAMPIVRLREALCSRNLGGRFCRLLLIIVRAAARCCGDNRHKINTCPKVREKEVPNGGPPAHLRNNFA